MRTFAITALCTALITLFTGLSPAATAAAGASPETALMAAHRAYLKGDRAALARQAEAVRGHALEAYADFWRLKLGLGEADPADVRDFLARNAGTVLAEQLRRDWLRLLGRTGQWDLFRQERPLLAQNDADIACYALQDRWRRQEGPLRPGLDPFWNASRSLPAACEPVADALYESGALTPDDLRDRFRLLVRNNRLSSAERLAERLPEDRAPRPDRIPAVYRAPARFLEGPEVDLRTAAGRELAIVALSSLAADDPTAAADRWDRMAQSAFPPADQQYVWAVLATHGAYQRVPEAVDWFRKAGATPLTDEQLAWRARIALRQHRWADVNAAVERMSPASRREAAWTYWQGRALVALGRLEEGRKLYARLAGGTDFYGLLAAEELGRPLAVPPPAAPPTAEELAAAAERPGLKRALLLFRLGLRSEATREWDWAVRPLDDRSLLAASELARRNGLWDRVIFTADRTVAAHDFSLRYPTPYRDALSGQARLRRLDEALVFGLVRQESRFIAYAQSSAGARGLMQLMPATARRVARKIGLKGYRLSRVQQPEVNAALGTGYLRGMLDLFDGSPVLAAAAYNAGPGRAHRWRDAAAPLEGAIYVETIPFSETRQYVKKVMANAMHYAALLGGGTQPTLRARLGTIAGAAGSRPPEDE